MQGEEASHLTHYHAAGFERCSNLHALSVSLLFFQLLCKWTANYITYSQSSSKLVIDHLKDSA